MLAVVVSAITVYTASAISESKVERLKGLPVKGPCDQSKECIGRKFASDEKALCYGTYGCAKATFDTTSNVRCLGAASCYRANFYGSSDKVLCAGYKSCEMAKGEQKSTGITAGDSIICDGFQACVGVKGGLDADNVKCDGSLACSAKKNTKTNKKGETVKLDITATNEILCNGNAACYASQQDSTMSYCDGDAACFGSVIETNYLKAHGKRVAAMSTLRIDRGDFYGFHAASNSLVIPMEHTQNFFLRALGFNSMAFATIETRGKDTEIQAWGYRALVGATVDCGGGSRCKVSCKGISCKGATITVAKNSQLTMDPVGCDPCSPGFDWSRKDANLPAKEEGVSCPLICYAKKPFKECKNYLSANCEFSAEEKQFIADAKLELEAWDATEEQALDAYVSNLEQQFVEVEIPEEEEEQQQQEETLMFSVDALSASTAKTAISSLIISNLLTAIGVSMVCALVLYCYKRVSTNAGYKALPQ